MTKFLPGKTIALLTVVALTGVLLAGMPSAGASVALGKNQLLNAGAEKGLESWETGGGVLAAAAFEQDDGMALPRSGGKFFALSGAAADAAYLEQEVDLENAAGVSFTMEGWIQTAKEADSADIDANDYGEVTLTFYDADGEEVGAYTTDKIGNPVAGTGASGYARFDVTDNVPDDAVKVAVRLTGYRVNGDRINVFYDDLKFSLNNEAPEAATGSVATRKNTAVEITLSAADADNDDLTYIITREPEHGELSDLDGNRVTYTPDEGYAGRDYFAFKAYDGTAYSKIAIVSIAVLADDHAPIAFDSAVTVDIDAASVEITLVANDPNGAALTYAIVGQPKHGELSEITDNKVTYTPDAGYTGADRFTFRADNGSAESNPATVTISVRSAAETAAGLVWLPPVNKTGLVINTHRTLPIRFVLANEAGAAITKAEALKLVLTGPDRDGDAAEEDEEVEEAEGLPVQGKHGIKVNAKQGVYTCLFTAKGLADGEYTLTVYVDGSQVGEPLTFTVAAKGKAAPPKAKPADHKPGAAKHGPGKPAPAAHKEKGNKHK